MWCSRMRWCAYVRVCVVSQPSGVVGALTGAADGRMYAQPSHHVGVIRFFVLWFICTTLVFAFWPE